MNKNRRTKSKTRETALSIPQGRISIHFLIYLTLAGGCLFLFLAELTGLLGINSWFFMKTLHYSMFFFGVLAFTEMAYPGISFPAQLLWIIARGKVKVRKDWKTKSFRSGKNGDISFPRQRLSKAEAKKRVAEWLEQVRNE